MGGRKFFVTGLAVFSFLLISVSAYAATIEQEFVGSLYLVNPISNEYGITAGPISWTVGYDNDATKINQLQHVTVFDLVLPGGTSYGLDDFPSAGEPWVVFDGSDITEIVFSSSTFLADGTGSPTIRSGEGDDMFTLEGVTGVTEGYAGDPFSGEGFLRITPIPIPGAVWLLGAGLIGLAGLRKRFRKA